jgi:photosystem II stability/assembly factor-like uncharacterized protein
MRRVWWTLMVAALAMWPGIRSLTQAQPVDPALYSGLRWRMIGPFRGGRVNAVAGVPGEPNVFYFGSVGGGLWKSTNAGRTWNPIFDSENAASIGAIAVAASDSNVIYVGTGEADMRDSIAFGDGVYKSTDAGRTWTRLGLESTRQIGKIAVDPANANVVFVAAMGHLYGPNPDRGVFRSRDGGRTWQKVLFTNDNVGAIDVVIDPRNSQVVYASLWNTRRPPWYIYAPTNGPGGGIYKSTDGGSTWTQLTSGLAAEGFGRSGIAIAPSLPTRVYAIVDAKEGGLYRSDDAGATWTKASADARLWGRGWYFTKVAVDPRNPEIVYVPNVAIYRSKDGGKTWGAPMRGSPGGDDYHQLWINPTDPAVMIVASDQGAIVTVNGTADIPDWSSWLNQPTAQIYHVAPDRRFPYWVTGAQQDSGAVQVHSRSDGAGISMRDWKPLCAGGESGYTAPDPAHPAIVFGGTVSWCNVETGETKNVSPERNMSEPARHAWTQPLVFSGADPRALYFGNQFLYKTVDAGEHWTQISQDLTREDPGEPANLDDAARADVTPQQARNKRRGVIYTIAPSRLRAPLIWVGTDDGYIHVTEDDGKTWKNVTPPSVTAWTKVVMIEASHFDPNTAYAAVERHQLEDYDPHIYRTRDTGKTWQEIARGLPRGIYVQTVKEDPVRRGMLFAGTERAVHVSFDSGDSWQSLKLNMPAVSVRDIAIHENDVIAATHGRGFWVLDDIAALRQTDAAARADAFLFKPSDAFNLAPATDDGTPVQKDEPQAENAPGGAVIDYYLKKSAATGPVVLEILDGSGRSVRRYSSSDPVPAPDPAALNVSLLWRPAPPALSAAAGKHRWIWDLRGTPPAGAGGGRGGGGGGRGGAPAAPPGTYSVRLTVDGTSYTQPLVIKPDPRSGR